MNRTHNIWIPKYSTNVQKMMNGKVVLGSQIRATLKSCQIQYGLWPMMILALQKEFNASSPKSALGNREAWSFALHGLIVVGC